MEKGAAEIFNQGTSLAFIEYRERVSGMLR